MKQVQESVEALRAALQLQIKHCAGNLHHPSVLAISRALDAAVVAHMKCTPQRRRNHHQ